MAEAVGEEIVERHDGPPGGAFPGALLEVILKKAY